MTPPNYDLNLICRCIGSAFPLSQIAEAQLLSGGLINTNIRITFSSNQPPVVLRLYRGEASVCRKEIQILKLVRSIVPVPEVFHYEANGLDGSPPFCIMEFIEGVTFQQLKQTGDLEAIQQAAASVGGTLAAIDKFEFQKPGSLIASPNDGLAVGNPYVEGPDPIPRILDSFLQSPQLGRWMDDTLRKEVHDFAWSWAIKLPAIENEHRLVHSDFGNQNLLVRQVHDRWQVVAILDWEFAFSGSPLLDVGHFLRYENTGRHLREPYFSRAFVEHGGTLPDDWRRIARVIDLTGLVECLTHDYVPDDVALETLGLIKSTLEECRV